MIRSQVLKRTLASAGAAALAVGALAGCSQVASLGPVGGASATTMEIATNSVLVSNKINVLEAAKCTVLESKETECKGKTVDGQAIVSHGTAPVTQTHTMAPGGTPTAAADGILAIEMTVKVGKKTIYKGPAQAIIDQDGEK